MRGHTTLKHVAVVVVALAIGVGSAACTPARPSERSTVALPAAWLDSRWVGYYLEHVPTETASLASLETKTGQRAAVSHYFLGVGVEPFNTTMARNAVAHGATPMITLEFWDYREETTEQSEYSLARIASGAHDAYLRQFARDAKALEHPILLRPLHEMNGSWYPWCGTVNGNSPSEFIPAWRHVCDVFREEGADNVRFVWCPDATSVPSVPDNSIPVYWPGESYVDYVALDGYNRGVPDSWRSFSEIFGPAYELVASLTDRPLFVAETGCAEAGGDKAVWIAEMFRDLTTTYPRITGIVWFNRRKERDWRIESSGGSLAAYREGAQRWAAAAPSQ